MEATQAHLLSLLDGKKQFTIPIYQRTYSWQLKQCDKLLSDIVRVGQDDTKLSHFIGSIVYFNPSNSPMTSIPDLLVIDGQQRLTTVSLLLLAITHFLSENSEIQINEDETWEEIQETYLINRHRTDSTKFKLLLTRKDKETYINLVNKTPLSENPSKRVVENYNFFKSKISADNIASLYAGIKKLIIVDVILEREKDNPQLIFESLNSTGLDLSQADLIRNYVLMSQNMETQTSLYEGYWYPMEQSFGENISYLPWFIRDYLTMKESSIPKISLVYETYKRYLNNDGSSLEIDEAVKDLFDYSQYYVRIVLLKESEPSLLKRFKDVSKLRMDTSYPFLIAVYGDYDDGLISLEEFCEIVDLVKDYVFRRAICGIPTNSLNKTFATLYKKIKRETYLESVKAAFLLMDGYRRFPNDTEFAREIVTKDVYNFRSRNYLLESLENYGRKELVNAENYTIEHVMPQNPNLSVEWRTELGENWQSIQSEFLHTIGNLSLTGYNSELSDRPFSQKKQIQGGFNDSPLWLNESIRVEDSWNQNSISRRARKLADRACRIWLQPVVDEERLNLYKVKETKAEDVVYTKENYEYLQGDILTLFEQLEKRVLNIDSSVRVEFKKLYIAFKAQTNFVDVVPQKKRLRLSLNMEFPAIMDPKGKCKDVSGLGRWGNGDVEVGLENSSELDYIMELIEQAFEAQMETT